MEIASLVASIVSIVIGVFALLLAITFYRMSTRESAKTIEAANEISSGVKRLDELFNKLYADTFGMMRDTIADMRKHAWPEDSKDEHQKVDLPNIIKDVSNQLKRELEASLREVIEDHKIPKEESKAIEKDLDRRVNNILDDTRQRLHDLLTTKMKEWALANIGSEGIRAQFLFSGFIERFPSNNKDFFALMNELKGEGEISWRGGLNPGAIIYRVDKAAPGDE